MAWTLQLLNDDTTLDLNDGTIYRARSPFTAPVPTSRTAIGGRNLNRHGADITQRVYNNRTVTASLLIGGTSQDNLIANINAIHSLLERGAEYTTTGLGSQLILRRKWENATNQVDFHVLTGRLAIGDEFSPAHTVNIKIAAATLTLLCKPFAYGAEETIANYVADPGFEVAGTALADWTESKTATGTTARDSSVKKDGTASLKLVMTNSGGSGQVIERNQVLADVDATEVWSFQCWVRVDALSNCKVVMELDYNTGTDVEVSTTTVNSSEFVNLTANNNTVPGSVTQVTLRIRLEATAGSATGIVYVDDVIAVLASAVPVAWASSRSIANHYADSTGDSQVTTNYIDIHDVPGDIPALLQVKVAEGQSHDEFWSGARHAGRQYDGSIILETVSSGHAATSTPTNFTTTLATSTNAVYSDGNARYTNIEATGGSDPTIAVGTYSKHTFTIASPPDGQFRVLVAAQAKNGQGTSGTTAINASYFLWGLNYSYGDFDLLDTTSPDVTSFVALPAAALSTNVTSAFTLLDLGTITIPPIGTPANQTAASLALIIHQRLGTGFQFYDAQEIQWITDFAMLMPIDYGANYVSKTDAADVILLDSMSETKGMYLLDTSDVVQSFPSNQLGRSPEAHPDGTRVYVLAQNGTYTKADTFTVSVAYRPRFLHVMGA